MICAVLYVYFVVVTLCFKLTSFYIEKINGEDTNAFMTSFQGTSFHICFGITVICFTRLPANGSSRRYDDSNDYNHNEKRLLPPQPVGHGNVFIRVYLFVC